MKKWIALLLAAMMLISTSAVAEEVYPIYKATARTQEEANFFDKVDPEWFNQSGQAKYESTSRRARSDLFTFADGAQLDIDTSYISYIEYDGEHYMIYGEDPEHPGGPFARPSFASEIGYVAFDQLVEAIYHPSAAVPSLEKTELSGVTLAQAEAAVEAMLNKLGLKGYERTYALDMSTERIREWGSAYVEEHKTYYNIYDRYYDFSTATEADEGYYLIYTQTLNGLPVGNPDGTENACAFVNASGIVTFELRNSYAIGDVYSTPEKLLSEEEIRKCFEADNDRRIKDHFFEPIYVKATLKYAPMRAPEKKDGMVMVPAYYIEYTFMDGSISDGWAWYSAVDGKLIMDCYS